MKRVNDEVWEQTADQGVRRLAWKQVSVQVRNQVLDQVWGQVLDQVWGQVLDQP